MSINHLQPLLLAGRGYGLLATFGDLGCGKAAMLRAEGRRIWATSDRSETAN
ncbi:MAG: hypothetical protein V7K55_15135 [Nostoc sp.]|uniref:hypothetical protein n=1 Tax=Nostoc sp. TaxID=1180 RepID=UPI002FF79F11